MNGHSIIGSNLAQLVRSRLKDFEKMFPLEAKALKPGWGRRKIFALLSDKKPHTYAQINSMFKRGTTEKTKKLYHGNYVAHAVRLMNDQLKKIRSKYVLAVSGDSVQVAVNPPSPARPPRRRGRGGLPTATRSESATLDKRQRLDAKREIMIREEQGILRRRFFRGKDIGTCGICGRAFPVALLVAGHIKRRALCTMVEKRDFSNIMPVCKLGCDDLFERAYVTVSKGLILANPCLPQTRAVKQYVKSLLGRKCAYWRRATASYFEAHHKLHSKM